MARGRAPAAEASLRARLLQGLALETRRLTVDGTATAVLEGGSGPPLVLLHGGIECGGVMWAPVVAGLVARHRLVIPDLPGLGESAPITRLDVAAVGRWFTDLVRQTCPEPPVVVAHSLLGSYAAAIAPNAGRLLRRLVLYAAPGIGPYHMPLRLRVVAIRFGVRPTARNAERFERFALFDLDATRGRDPGWFDAFSAYTTSRATVPFVKATMRRLIGAGTARVPDTELQRIDVPTTLLWGRHDRMAPLPVGESARDRLGWPLHVIDDAAHAPHIEQPESFVAALMSAIEPSTTERSRP